ncbi:MAG: glycosyltransferase [Succinivibrionaceae bacterium]
MKISVAVIAHNGGENFRDCMHSITNQRVIKADEITVYDYKSTDNTKEIASLYKSKIVNIDEYNPEDPYFTIKQIFHEHKNSDILIIVQQYNEIDQSAISELFRHFLTTKNLGVVYGRTTTHFENNHLSRFYHNYFFPITSKNYPLNHIARVFTSFNLIAFNMKYINEPGVLPDSSQGIFLDLYICGKIIEHGYKVLYNPLAMCKSNVDYKAKHVFLFSKQLFLFLKNNPWFSNKWYFDKKDPEMFFSNFKYYLQTNTSIPLLPFFSLICYVYFKIGELIADIEYKNQQKIEQNKNLSQEQNKNQN